MVDVNSFFPTKVPKLTMKVAEDMVDLRIKISDYYHKLEMEKGHFPKEPNIAMPQTQDYARLTAFRVLEELAEAFWSKDFIHVKEELIDATNYLLNLTLLCLPKNVVVNQFFTCLCTFRFANEVKFDGHALASCTSRLAGEFPDTLRNRSWMNNAQDLIWNGAPELGTAFEVTMGYIMECFKSWEEFYRYYIAKNKVLEFRIESNY